MLGFVEAMQAIDLLRMFDDWTVWEYLYEILQKILRACCVGNGEDFICSGRCYHVAKREYLVPMGRGSWVPLGTVQARCEAFERTRPGRQKKDQWMQKEVVPPRTLPLSCEQTVLSQAKHDQEPPQSLLTILPDQTGAVSSKMLWLVFTSKRPSPSMDAPPEPTAIDRHYNAQLDLLRGHDAPSHQHNVQLTRPP